jgi:hypothetical protein
VIASLLFPLLLAAAPPQAADPALLTLPILDLPDEHGAYAVPTWDQSVEVTKAQYQASHRAIAAWAEGRFDPERRESATMSFSLGWELVASLLPFGHTWAHEEGHRAVLDHRGIRSFNGVYDFDPRSGAVYVRRIRDEDLIRLKSEHPADSVRLAAAGMETATVLSLRLERDLFFLRGQPATDWATLFATAINNTGYVWTCSDEAFDGFTDDTNEADGSVIVRRDALGLDCTAWAYDLNRPDEPYEARGTHPSGRGIDRYRKFGDLSREEKKLLRTVRLLALANFADPFLFLEDGWGTEERRASTSFGFFLTSFGWSVDQNVFLALGEKNVLITMHHAANGARWAPGLDAQVWRLPIVNGASLTLGAGLWLQPHEQRWETARMDPGARLHATIAFPVWRALEVELAAAHKTAGWVAAVPALESETSFRAGLSWRLR